MQAMTGAFALLLLVVTVWFAYLLAALWQMQRQAGWPTWRLASFTCGTALLVAALSPPLMSWGHVDLRGHIAQLLTLGMFAPMAQLMYYGGNLAEMVLALLLFAGWYREAGRRVPTAVMNR